MFIRLASDLQENSIVDGEGIRAVIWTQGCPHNCPGCHNPETHDYNGGFLKDISELEKEIDALDSEVGVTFSGGDPFVQPKECAEIAHYCHSIGLNVWCYTGYTYEALLKKSEKHKEIMDFLKEIDILVDGRFLIKRKSYTVKFRGSSNQRLIDVKKSLKSGNTVIYDLDKSNKRMFYNRDVYI